jgi:hypothetical protein
MEQVTTCRRCGAPVSPDARSEIPEPAIRRRSAWAALYVVTMVVVASITAAVVYFLPL